MAVMLGAAAGLIVIGTVRRWRWMFWVVLVLLGLNAVNVLVPLLLHVAGLLPGTPRPARSLRSRRQRPWSSASWGS